MPAAGLQPFGFDDLESGSLDEGQPAARDRDAFHLADRARRPRLPRRGTEQVYVIVAGGPEPTHATVVPSHPSCRPVTERIRMTRRAE
jgi:hypothetical protein